MGRVGRVDCLIFSRDRAAQLDLLLRSVDRYASAVYRTVSVLWTCSDALYERGYDYVQMDHPRVRFGREQSFERDTRDWLARAGDVVSFLVDDDVFYRQAPQPERLPWSYRGGDYWYPFSLDGNVYERKHVDHLLVGVRFRDPTQLEARGHEQHRRLPFAEVYPCSPPCLVGVPANRVSPSSGMPHDGVDVYALNARYLAGERLAIPTVPYGVDLRAHESLELAFA